MKKENKKKHIIFEEAWQIVKERYNINGCMRVCYNKTRCTHPLDERYIEFNCGSAIPGGGFANDYGEFWESEITLLTKDDFIKYADSYLRYFIKD